MMIYFVLSKGRRNLSPVVSDLVFLVQCSGSASVSVKWKKAGVLIAGFWPFLEVLYRGHRELRPVSARCP